MKWLRVDASLGDAYVSKSIGYLPGAGGGFSIEFDLVVPAATFAALIAASQTFTVDWVQILAGSGDGVWSNNDPPWTFQADSGVVASPPAVTTDVAIHILFSAVNTTGVLWHRVASADGVPFLDTVDGRFGNPTVNHLDGIDLGAIFASPIVGEIYYLDNVVVKDGPGSVLFSDDFESGTLAAWDSITGDATVVDFTPGGGGTPPINTDCASAAELIGCSGTETGDNSAWAGTWPTGNDPLFTAEGVGGGAPLWWKWTNTRPRPMLFRFQVTTAPLNTYNAGIAIGACGTLDMSGDALALQGINVEGGNVSGEYSGSDFGTGSVSYFDIIVDPGHTVFIEIDSYDGTVTEPPVPSSGQKGAFGFDWWAYEYTTGDDIEGEILPAFPSELLIDPVSPINDPAIDPSGEINPYGTLRHGNKLYMLWGEEDTHGQSIFAGVCNLDGTGLATTLIWNQHASSLPPVRGDIDQPRLMSDGNSVYVGFPWIQLGGVPNPNYSDSCGSHAPVFLCDECSDTAGNILRYSIYKYDGAGWPLLVSIGDVTNGQPYPQVDMTDTLDSAMLARYLLRACASPSQPGKLWVHIEYIVGERDQSLHFNDYPLVGPPPGALYCTDDRHYEVEYVDTFSVDTGTGAVTLVSRASNEVGETQHWDHDDPTVDPAFGTWQFFDDGDLVTNPTLHRTSITCVSMDMRNDDGVPVLARCGIQYWTWGTTPSSPGAHTVEVLRPDTGTALGTYTYNDFAAGHDTRTDVWCRYIVLSERWAIVGGYERGIGTSWVLDGSPFGGGADWLDRIKSDGTTAPKWLVDGHSNSSFLIPPAMTLIKDPVKAPQFWKVTWTAQGLDAAALDCYDPCSLTWGRVGYTTFGELGSNYRLSEQTYYDPATDYFYILNQKNQLRRNKILRDYEICDIGAPCILGLPVFRNVFKAGDGASPVAPVAGDASPVFDPSFHFKAGAADTPAAPSAGAATPSFSATPFKG